MVNVVVILIGSTLFLVIPAPVLYGSSGQNVIDSPSKEGGEFDCTSCVVAADFFNDAVHFLNTSTFCVTTYLFG